MKLLSATEKQTQKIGQKLALGLKDGDILCLYGELGAGKTTMVKGLAKGLGIKKEINSPTFALMNIYKTKTRLKTVSLVHIDTYRLKNDQELIDIGAEDYLGAPDTICVVEWPEKIKNLLKNKKTVKIVMEYEGKKKRIITIT
ncbi:MAG: tRNA (adenosine(37)-N6)-threonylcarbamoyltransferase complex ATPase subunit type 1 TsaE [Patescibacteria group bacterium]